jgi:hypothetical protein
VRLDQFVSTKTGLVKVRSIDDGAVVSDWRRTYEIESALASAVDEYLAKRGDVLITRVESGGQSKKRLTLKGTADRVGVVGPAGRHIELELKRTNGKSSPAQIARGERIRKLGGVYEVCRSVQQVHEAIERAMR